jgi:NAD(P)-dependent dehydrogenase (short-subunit alcohol dehydrogenase family)
VTSKRASRTFGRNVKGVPSTVQKATPLLAEGASVILTGSTTGSTGNAGLSVYGASKAAVRAFARNWILDLQGRNIRINTLSPGATRTEACSPQPVPTRHNNRASLAISRHRCRWVGSPTPTRSPRRRCSW